MQKKLRIIFMGTPAFAVPSLDILVRNGFDVVAVVTAPDKPAGRGRQVKMPDVKQYAVEHNIPVLQPPNLKDESWTASLASLQADLQVVVAFRMLPEKIWSMPPLGTLNLHASLLPQYRGAAPIQWAILNGEKETGLTTFFLQHEIDTGNIIFREKLSIGATETGGELHDRMMVVGAALLLKTVEAIASGSYPSVPQEELSSGIVLRPAPRIYKDTCLLHPGMTAMEAYNRVRGLSPYPAAYVELKNVSGSILSMKIFRCEQPVPKNDVTADRTESDGKTFLRLGFSDGWLSLSEVQPAGKSRMGIRDFLNGWKYDATLSFS